MKRRRVSSTATLMMKRTAPLASSFLFCTPYRNTPIYASPALYQCLHTTASRTATPLPITAAGPPPSAPLPAASQYGERVDRRRRQAELLERGQDLRTSQMKPGSAMKKRFWKDVSVQIDDGMIMLLMDQLPSSIPLSQFVLHLY